ncbi:aromatic acid exporter family protein [Streptomyces lydicus]|uniref:aromatic acid exporter family protein n=2 Tax=Streptomyces lydicus TaxID=47763 RepID=UPI003788CD21
MARSQPVAVVRRWLAETWPLAQAAAAATVAWVIALRLAGHADPFFAPIAAVVALNFAQGERGRSAVRLVLGTCVGIVVGELTLVLLAGGWGSLALATFVALVVAQALGANRLMRVQAAAGAILAVAVADGEAGTARLTDALIGAGVALVFTQVLFSPEPVALVRRAETAALGGMADILRMAAETVEHGTQAEAQREGLTRRMHGAREQLDEVGRAGPASARIASHSLIWRHERPTAARMNEEAGRIELLGVSCLMLIRTLVSTDPPRHSRLAHEVRELADALTDLATGLGDLHGRQRAVDRAFAVARRAAGEHAWPQMTLEAVAASVRFVCFDIMMFAGVAPQDAKAAVEQGAGEPWATAPPRDLHLLSLPRRLLDEHRHRP